MLWGKYYYSDASLDKFFDNIITAPTVTSKSFSKKIKVSNRWN